MSDSSLLLEATLRVAQIVPCTEAEGPGRRFALWLQGCPLRCAGCCNPQMLPFAGGETVSVAALVEQIRLAAEQHGVEGISLLGGEPTAQAVGASRLGRLVQGLGLSVMLYSGFTLEDLQGRADPSTLELLEQTDLLVDGPYRNDLPETRRRWVGSTNQRVHALSDRYRIDDPCWDRPNTLEIRLNGSVLTVNGFPSRSATGLWKRPKASTEGRT